MVTARVEPVNVEVAGYRPGRIATALQVRAQHDDGMVRTRDHDRRSDPTGNRA